MSYDTKEKRVFSCDTKEENMDSTDSALDEIVSSYKILLVWMLVQDFQ